MQTKVDRYTASALFILVIMFALMVTSAWDDTAITDELAHIPAGYSYLTQFDMRLNPEHPPLIKDLAGVPLLAQNFSFPASSRTWQEDINGQWDFGRAFLYGSGNNPDTILRLARIPMMLFAVVFGFLFFLWARIHYGASSALLALTFFAFSPTLLAHGRYVTTDIAAAFGFFIGIVTFLAFLENQNKKTALIAGIAFGIAQLLKFSLFLLTPLYALIFVVWFFVFKPKIKNSILHTTCRILLIFSVGLALIWLVYIPHVWNYPQERQLRDADFILGSFGFRPAVDSTLWLIEHEITRPLGQYVLGLLMVIQRATGGNTTYFLGEVSATGWKHYFPVVYLLKEHLAFHILTLIAIGAFIKSKIKNKELLASYSMLIAAIKKNFTTFSVLLFIVIYSLLSIRSNLNIGVRHLLPILPFLYLLVASGIMKLSRARRNPLIVIAVAWMIVSAATTFPFYLSYFHVLAGGTEGGWQYVVDSNYDWGQDLKRLATWAEEHRVDRLYLDYFGGGDPRYYLGNGYEPWNSAKGALPSGNYFAISATLRQGAFGKPASGFEQKSEDSYLWLRELKPISRAGTSIFIYRIP